MRVPPVRFADSGGCSIAYQVVGDGPVDLLFIPGLVSHLDLQWGDVVFANTLERLAAVSRLIIFDNRGVGLSDRVRTIPTLDERVSDARAVMADAGCERAVVLGHCNGGPTAAMLAATHPEQVRRLVLCSTFAKGAPDDVHPGALGSDVYQVVHDILSHWGEGRSVELWNPTRARERLYPRMYAVFERAALSPASALASLKSTLEIDVTALLGAIHAPTLVLHCREDFVSHEAGRFLADTIPGATFVELPGAEHVPFSGGCSKELIDHVVGFIAEEGSVPPRSPAAGTFGTILFVDIVGSTGKVASVGDDRWRELMVRLELAVHQLLDRHDGEFVKSTGDGYLATFPSADAAVRCAQAMVAVAATEGVPLRAACHAGRFERVGHDIAGIEVHTAARLLDHAGADDIVVSDTVRSFVTGSDLQLAPLGAVALRGIDAPMRAFRVEGTAAERPDSWTGEHPDPAGPVQRAFTTMARRTPGLLRAATAMAHRTR